MTRALLEQALKALEGVLDAPVGAATQFWSCSGGVYEAVECNNAINAIQAELAKPAPSQPAWHDAPNAPGLWVWDRGPLKLQHLIAVGNLQDYLTREPTSPERWFGPIPLPEDTK